MTHEIRDMHALETDLTNARELTLDEWDARPWYHRVAERVVHPLGPLL